MAGRANFVCSQYKSLKSGGSAGPLSGGKTQLFCGRIDTCISNLLYHTFPEESITKIGILFFSVLFKSKKARQIGSSPEPVQTSRFCRTTMSKHKGRSAILCPPSARTRLAFVRQAAKKQQKQSQIGNTLRQAGHERYIRIPPCRSCCSLFCHSNHNRIGQDY